MSPVASLQQLCVRAAIANVHFLSDVGDLDERLLQRILPYCKEKELRRVARETKLEELLHKRCFMRYSGWLPVTFLPQGRDLTSVLDPCWKTLFSRRFGVPCTEEVEAKMQRVKSTYTWRQVYEAKEAALQQKLEEGGRRLTELSKQAEADNPKRQIKVLSADASAVAERLLSKRKRGAPAMAASSLTRIQKARLQSSQSPLAQIRTGIARRALPALPSSRAGGSLRPVIPASLSTAGAPARSAALGRPPVNSNTKRTASGGTSVSARGAASAPGTLHAVPPSRSLGHGSLGRTRPLQQSEGLAASGKRTRAAEAERTYRK